MAGTTTLICPKCQGQMRTYERNGVLVDQCEECRGIFLDRGELEQLLDAGSEPRARDHGRDHDEHHEDEGHCGGQGRRRGRANALLEGLLGGE